MKQRDNQAGREHPGTVDAQAHPCPLEPFPDLQYTGMMTPLTFALLGAHVAEIATVSHATRAQHAGLHSACLWQVLRKRWREHCHTSAFVLLRIISPHVAFCGHGWLGMKLTPPSSDRRGPGNPWGRISHSELSARWSFLKRRYQEANRNARIPLHHLNWPRQAGSENLLWPTTQNPVRKDETQRERIENDPICVAAISILLIRPTTQLMFDWSPTSCW